MLHRDHLLNKSRRLSPPQDTPLLVSFLLCRLKKKKKKKMSLLRSVIQSSASLRVKPNQALLFLRGQQKLFSTGTVEQQEQASPIDPFLQSPSKGFIYGKLTGTGRYTLKTDIINMLEGCELSPQDIKVEYNRLFTPVGMIVQFPSRVAFDSAVRTVSRNRGLYRLEKTDRSHWDITSYDGKTVLLQGIPRNTVPEDVERFLSGCDLSSRNMELFLRQAFPDPIKMALVHFPSQTAAMNAVLLKNRSFCLNNQVAMRVLQ